MKNKFIAIVIIIVAILLCTLFADFEFGGNTVEIGGQEIVLK